MELWTFEDYLTKIKIWYEEDKEYLKNVK